MRFVMLARSALPPVPVDADVVLLRPDTVFRWEPVCLATPVMRAWWGFGMVGYLLSRAGAQRLLDSYRIRSVT